MTHDSFPDFTLPSAEVTDRLHTKKWQGRQFGYGPLISDIKHHVPIAAPAISVIVEITAPDIAAVIGFKVLLEQHTCNFQLIMVANGEPSPLAEILLRMGHTAIRLQQSVNSSTARNIGALFADASIIVFLSDTVQAQADLLTQYCACFATRAPLAVRGTISGVEDLPAIIFGRFSRVGIPHAWALDLDENMAIDAQSFFHLGGFDELLPVGYGALDLSVRLLGLCPDEQRQWYLPSAGAIAGASFNVMHRQATHAKSWFVLNQKYALSMLGYCVFWLENVLKSKDIHDAALV